MSNQTALRFNRGLYNNLRTVEQADKVRKSTSSFDIFLKKAAELIREAGLELDVGVFLLHHHFVLEPQEVMLESSNLVENKIVTTPHRADELRHFSPCRWACRDCICEPIEFSTDPCVSEVSKQLELSNFFEEYANLVSQFRLNNLAGLTVVRRKNLPANTGQIYVERSYSRDRSSVVTIENERSFADDLIETTWTYSRIIAGCQKTYNCVTQYGCVPAPEPGGLHAPVPSGHTDMGSHVYVPLCRPHGCV